MIKIELNKEYSMEINIEQYQNLVELLKQALLFYGNKDNYIVNQPINTELTSMVELDDGFQARFALSKIIENNDEFNISMINDIKNKVKIESPNQILNMIEKYKENYE